MIQRKSFKKWLLITSLCGAHSFLWGAIGQGNLLAMLLGILTLALMFAAIESHPNYQARRAAAPRLARALDGGVKFRCWLAVYVPISIFIGSVAGDAFPGAWLVPILAAPYSAELFVGMGAMSLTEFLTGLKINGSHAVAQHAFSAMDNFIATYLTTIFTGLAHTIILGIICLAAYGVVRVRSSGKAV